MAKQKRPEEIIDDLDKYEGPKTEQEKDEEDLEQLVKEWSKR